MKKSSLFLTAALALGLVVAPLAMAKEIKVGGIFDITGATSDVGKDYGTGAVAAEKFINEKGGIAGDKIKLIPNDYAYKIPEAVNLYKKYLSVDKVFVIQGWGTGDTNALKPLVNKDKVVYFSASYDGNLTDPKETPYNFFIGTDYSTSIRAAIKFAKEQGAKKFVFIYPDHPYGKNPIPAGKEYAKEVGLDVGPDQIVELKAIDATSQLLAMKQFDPDFAWIGGTTASAAVIIKDAAKLAGEAAEGRAFGMVPVAPFGADVPGMKDVVASAGGQAYSLHYVKAWVSMMVMNEGLKRAQKAGKLDAPGLKAALETIKDFDTGGLTAPITYSATDHRPNTTLTIYTVGKGGKMEKVKEMSMPRDPKQVGK
jgi:branched-chain amino acid transport system substrate-binding protein